MLVVRFFSYNLRPLTEENVIRKSHLNDKQRKKAIRYMSLAVMDLTDGLCGNDCVSPTKCMHECPVV